MVRYGMWGLDCCLRILQIVVVCRRYVSSVLLVSMHDVSVMIACMMTNIVLVALLFRIVSCLGR